MHDLHAKLEDMETTQRRTVDVGDLSESENEDEAGHGEEEVTAEDAANERLKLLREWVQRQRWTF